MRRLGSGPGQGSHPGSWAGDPIWCVDCGRALDRTAPTTMIECSGPAPVYRCYNCWRAVEAPHLAVLAALQEEYDRDAVARHRRIVEVLA